MTNSRMTLLAATALLLAAPAAMAQSYPRVTGDQENIMIDYGPMGQGNLVGGGRVTVSANNTMNIDVMHLDAMFSLRPREGYVPLTIGSGEAQDTIWVPAAMLEMMRRTRAGMPAR